MCYWLNRCFIVLFLLVGIVFFDAWTIVCANEIKKSSLPCFLLENTAAGAYAFGDIFFLEDQNQHRMTVISNLFKRRLSKQSIGDAKDVCSIHNSFKSNPLISAPTIEYRKLSPTKYRVRVHGMNEGFPLVFNDTFDRGWRAYLVPWGGGDSNRENQSLLDMGWVENIYAKTMGKNWASVRDIRLYLEHGWLTDLRENGKSSKKKAPLISRNVQYIAPKQANTIQNNNLSTGLRLETWFSDRVMRACNEQHGCDPLNWENWIIKKGWKGGAIEWPSLFHWQANAYANSWWIDPGLIKALTTGQKNVFYHENNFGGIDAEFVLEYVVQRWFDVGFIISIVGFLLLIIVIFFSCCRWIFSRV